MVHLVKGVIMVVVVKMTGFSDSGQSVESDEWW